MRPKERLVSLLLLPGKVTTTTLSANEESTNMRPANAFETKKTWARKENGTQNHQSYFFWPAKTIGFLALNYYHSFASQILDDSHALMQTCQSGKKNLSWHLDL